MADDYKDKIQKLVKLDTSDIPKDKIVEAKNAVGNFIVDQILSNVGSGVSPVTGGKFEQLTKNYADKEKGGSRLPNLELEGDMLSSLGFKRVNEGIAVGIQDADQRPKADGHNHFGVFGKSQLPVRRFIPLPGEDFIPEIENEIETILDEYRVQEDVPTELTATELEITQRRRTEGGSISVSLSDILEADTLVRELLRRIGG